MEGCMTTIRLRHLSTLKKYAFTAVVAGSLVGMQNAYSEILFEENFDDLEDWTSAMYSTDQYQAVWLGNTLPEGWDTLYRSGYYSPPTAHASLEILASNADKARGGTGKSAVHWREHHINPDFDRQWKSNSSLGKYLEEGYEQLYVEFWISFDPEWTQTTAASKIFRVFSWDEEGEFWQAFGGGSQGPLFLWDYALDEKFGVRNKLSFRGGPHGENYKMSSEQAFGLPRGLRGAGDMSLNFTSDIEPTLSERDEALIDQTSGSTLQSSGVAWHEQVFGPPGTWTKMAFFVKMNSAPGAQDGVFRQWINDKLIVESTNVEWVGPNTENKMVKWNAVGIGGNDYWVNGGWDNSQQREEWYSIDDLVISTSILASESEAAAAAPNPPGQVTIQP